MAERGMQQGFALFTWFNGNFEREVRLQDYGNWGIDSMA